MISIREVIANLESNPDQVTKIKQKVDISKINLANLKFPLDKIKELSSKQSKVDLRSLGIYTYQVTHNIKDEKHQAYETKWVQHLGFRDCIDWLYKYCPVCNKVYYKKAFLCDFDNNIAKLYIYKNEEIENNIEIFNNKL